MRTAAFLSLILGLWRPDSLLQSDRFLDEEKLIRMRTDCELWVKLTGDRYKEQAQEAECKTVPVSGFELN